MQWGLMTAALSQTKKKKKNEEKKLQPRRLVNITFLEDVRDPHTRLKNCMHSCEISGLCTWWVALLLLLLLQN